MGCCESRHEDVPEEEGEGGGHDGGADWVRLGGEELEQPLREGWIKLICADWLIAHAERGGVLARRQDMPPSSFVNVDELKQAGAVSRGFGDGRVEWLRVLVLSYPWLQPGHPDPHGENLRLLVKCLKVYVGGSDSERKPYGVLIDFPGLFQVPRSEEEHEVFLRALPALNVFYSHPATVVLKITQFPPGYPQNPRFHYVLPEGANTMDYAERGWCFAESSMSGLVKPSTMVLALRHDHKLQTFKTSWDMLKDCPVGRVPPLHPAEFNEELGKKTFTSRKADFDKVNKLYSDAFERRLARAVELDFSGLGWGAGEVQQLSRALQGNAASLHRLHLSKNSLSGSQAAEVLVGVVQRNTALATLNVAFCDMGDIGAVALARVLESNHSLQTLFLGNNHILDEGIVALGKALENNGALQTLHLDHNVCGDRGAAALARALESNRFIRTLILSHNQVREEGMIALGEALKNNAALQELDLSFNRCNDGGAVALRQALESNRSLQQLDLRFNPMGEESKTALRKAHEKSNTLQKLDIL